jgi:hypothetical protein
VVPALPKGTQATYLSPPSLAKFAGVCIAEHEPWIALVGYAALGLDITPLVFKGFFSLF